MPLPVSNSHSFHSSASYRDILFVCLGSNSLHRKPNFVFGLYLNDVQLGSIEHAIATKSLLPQIDLP